MRSLLQGEHRRSIIMGTVGAAALTALLLVRASSSGDSDPFAALGAVPSAPSAGTVTPTTAPGAIAVAPQPVDPVRLRDPFCPLVAAAGAPAAGTAPVAARPPAATCRRAPASDGRRRVELQDIFVEAGASLARMHVGTVTFPNLHVGDTFGESFTVVSLSDRCGEFLAGQDRFPLCEGEETFK